MTSLKSAVLLALVALLASGCGSGRHASQPATWIRKANAVCKRDDPRAMQGVFDSAAMVDGLHREAQDLARVGFFNHVPAAGLDVETAGPLLFNNGGREALRKADRPLLDARARAASTGVHCSFGADTGIAGLGVGAG